jgi:hypothetical protein
MMNDIVDKGYWKEQLVGLQRKTATSIIEFSKAVAEYCDECESTKEFDADIKSWLNIGPAQSSKLIKIGNNAPLLMQYRQKLPSARSSLVEIVNLGEDKIKKAVADKVIYPEVTQREIKEYSNMLDAKEAKDKQDAKVEVAEVVEEEPDNELVEVEPGVWEFPSDEQKEEEYEERMNKQFVIDGIVKDVKKICHSMEEKELVAFMKMLKDNY